jgi:hypothetical protein
MKILIRWLKYNTGTQIDQSNHNLSIALGTHEEIEKHEQQPKQTALEAEMCALLAQAGMLLQNKTDAAKWIQRTKSGPSYGSPPNRSRRAVNTC